MKPFSQSEKAKFDKIKEKVLAVVRKLDNKKGLNIKRYEDMFKLFEANPDLFREWEVVSGPDELDNTIQMFQLPFEEMKMTQIKDAADELGIELEDYMYYRQDDPKGVRTKTKVPVGYVGIKRVQQILSKKNHYVFDVDERSLKTGDVKGESKSGSLSDEETYCLMAIGAEKTLEELLGPRADNIDKKKEMYRQIARDGFTTLEATDEIKSTPTALNTINTYLLAAGIRSDLITRDLKTTFTVDTELRKG